MKFAVSQNVEIVTLYDFIILHITESSGIIKCQMVSWCSVLLAFASSFRILIFLAFPLFHRHLTMTRRKKESTRLDSTASTYKVYVPISWDERSHVGQRRRQKNIT